MSTFVIPEISMKGHNTEYLNSVGKNMNPFTLFIRCKHLLVIQTYVAFEDKMYPFTRDHTQSLPTRAGGGDGAIARPSCANIRPNGLSCQR